MVDFTFALTHRAEADKWDGQDGQRHVAEGHLQATANILQGYGAPIVCKRKRARDQKQMTELRLPTFSVCVQARTRKLLPRLKLAPVGMPRQLVSLGLPHGRSGSAGIRSL